jgi:hypothetical protein
MAIVSVLDRFALPGRVAAVTGTSRGIGRTIAGLRPLRPPPTVRTRSPRAPMSETATGTPACHISDKTRQ